MAHSERNQDIPAEIWPEFSEQTEIKIEIKSKRSQQ